MSEEGIQFALFEARNVLEVVGFAGLPHQQTVRSVRAFRLLGKEQWVPRDHDAIVAVNPAWRWSAGTRAAGIWSDPRGAPSSRRCKSGREYGNG
jgi:hypothetical protein